MSRIQHRLRRAFAAASLMALAAGLCGPVQAAEKWKGYTYNAVATVTPVKGLTALFETIQKETNGDLSIRLHLGGTLPIMASNITQAVADNIMEFGDDAFYVGSVPVGTIVRFPLFVRTLPEFEKAWDAASPFLKADYDKKGVFVIGRYIFPSQSVWSRKKLTSLQDIAGQKIRVISPEQAEFIKAFGGTPVTLGTSEVAAALDRGVIDGVTTASSGYGYVWRDLLKYNYRIPIGLVDSLLLVNKTSWAKLSPATQQIVQQAVTDHANRITSALNEEEESLTRQLSSNGMTVTAPTAQEVAEAESRMKPYWASWPESRGPAAKEAFQKVRETIGR